jgi:hypothetical protein
MIAAVSAVKRAGPRYSPPIERRTHAVAPAGPAGTGAVAPPLARMLSPPASPAGHSSVNEPSVPDVVSASIVSPRGRGCTQLHSDAGQWRPVGFADEAMDRSRRCAGKAESLRGRRVDGPGDREAEVGLEPADRRLRPRTEAVLAKLSDRYVDTEHDQTTMDLDHGAAARTQHDGIAHGLLAGRPPRPPLRTQASSPASTESSNSH